ALAHAATAAAHAAQSGGHRPVRVPVRGLRPRGLRSASAHPRRGGGVTDGAGRAARHPRLVLLAAVAENGVIGRDNRLPWRLKSDMQHFRATTMGKPVVMGRKTYQSLFRPLVGRTTVVVTRDRNFTAPGVVVAADLPSALAAARGDALRRGADAVVVAGGGGIYEQTLPLADVLLITQVHQPHDGDATFSPIEGLSWRATHP